MSVMIQEPCDRGVIVGHEADAPCKPNYGPWILVATILGSSMAFIDSTVVNVALPVLQVDLHATVSQVQWVVEAFTLFLAALIIVGGALGDHYGRRRVYAMGIALFVAASVWCGLAPNITQLIIARGLQGIGGALLVPGSLAIISASFPENERGRAIGTWSGFSAIFSGAGPLVGGWLVEHLSWRGVFFINVPLGIIVIAILFWRVPESRDETATGHLDWWGAAAVTLGLGALTYGLIHSNSTGFRDSGTLGVLALGVLALAAFLLIEMRVPSPMVPLGLFRSSTFSGANLLTFLLYGALGVSLFLLPFNLIRVQGYTPTEAGAAFLPFIILLFVLSRWAGGLIERYGAKLPLMVGPTIVAIAFVLFTLPGMGGSYWTTFFIPITVMGIGMSIAVAPLTTAVLSAVEQAHAGIASGINNAMARAGGLLAIAVVNIFVLLAFERSLDSRLAGIAAPAWAKHAIDAQRIQLAGAQAPALTPFLHAQLQRAIEESFVTGFRLAMLICAVLALASALCAALFVQGKKAGEVPAEEPAAPVGQPAAAQGN